MAPVAGMGETEKCIQGFDDKMLKEECLTMGLGGTVWNGMNWFDLAQDEDDC